jgi:hypothetical protein
MEKKWLMIEEEIADKKIVGCTKTTVLSNLSVFLYKVRCKWEHHIEN